MNQQELEVFFNLSPDFQATLALDGSFKYWSPSWEQQLGYSGDELRSMYLSDLVAEAERPEFRKVLRQAAAGAKVMSYETRILPKTVNEPCANAKEAWISWSFTSEAELSSIFVSARCVTAQKEAQQALQEARVRAEEANRAKSDFLAVMSHELRTPLNPILGFADMLMEDAKTEEEKEILGIITQSGSRMLSLINEILEYSKLDAGKTELEMGKFSLIDFVEQKINLFSGQVQGGPVDLNYSIDWGPIDKNHAPLLIGDINMIRQICSNLISNAIKFTKQGRVDFNVAIEQVDGEQALVRFEVKDTGIGITKADLSKLFWPFTQVQAGTTREYGGTGLGLAICKRLVDLMDGKISAESQEGVGSNFSFTLPLSLHYKKGGSETMVEPIEPLSVTSKKKLAGRILLVEDNESNAHYVKTLVDLRGAEIDMVTQGEAALERLRDNAFDLVLLDLHMPGIGGLETLKRIKSSGKSSTSEVPVHILTADASTKAKEDCLQHGANGLLVKPIRPAGIFAILEEHLKEASSPRD